MLLVIAALLLVAVFIPGIGHEVARRRRWLLIGGFKLQASEVARVLRAVLDRLVRGAARAGVARDICRPAGAAGRHGLFCALLLPEPDFGAATVLFVTAFGLLFLAGARLRWVLGAGDCGAALRRCCWSRPTIASSG